MKLFDAHCHLHFPQFDADRDVVLARMREKGMGAVVIGTDYETSKAAVDFVSRGPEGPLRDLWASVGLHPNDNLEEKFDAEAFEVLARDPKVVAIGECGLDYFRSGGSKEEKMAQQERFEKQIALAQKLNKTLVVHCRNAHDDCTSVLQNTGITTMVPVVMHFFTGSGELAQKYLDLGCYLSFPGPITYTDMYDDSIRVCPLDRVLIETDAPFAAPVPYRGKRNEPAYVEHVAAKIAAVKGISTDEVAGITTQNAQKVFKLQK